MTRLAAALLGLALIAACSSPPPVKTLAPTATAAVSTETCALAHAKGGTVEVPCNDPAKMAELQGLLGGHAKVTIEWPREDEVIPAGTGAVRYTLSGYEIGKDEKGSFQHCHVILDDKPYVADYDHTTTLEALNGGAPVAEGSHILTIFPARNFHLSLKNDGACAQVRFHVKEKKGKVPAAKDPQPIYSRPKGVYDSSKGEAHAILCDYWLLNVARDKGQHLEELNVVITVTGPDGKRTKIRSEEWAPFILLRDPAPGKYKVTLELEERDDGDPLDVPFAQIVRDIEVK